jgi:hypothetical protein
VRFITVITGNVAPHCGEAESRRRKSVSFAATTSVCGRQGVENTNGAQSSLVYLCVTTRFMQYRSAKLFATKQVARR